MSSSKRWNTTGITILGTSSLTKVTGIFIDSQGTLFIADQSTNSVVWKLLKNTTTPIIVAGTLGVRAATATTLDYPQVAGTGSAGSGATALSGPRGIAFDSSMNMYVSEFTAEQVRKFLKL
ncbi:hypothetical protein I4U23_011158 [Adineta vaga]|nr:hypothetical protein I4U23_011158 [Adineta vaga]